MEMREINKDLKQHFGRLERQVEEYRVRHEQYDHRGGYYGDEHNETVEYLRGKRGKSNKSGRREPSDDRLRNTLDLSDKENALKTANLTNYVGMSIVQESQQEDKGFRKRQSMLSEI